MQILITDPTLAEIAASGELSPAGIKALLCARAALEKRAENVKILLLSEISTFTEFFVICSGASDRQVQAIADSVASSVKGAGLEILSTEGYSEGRWVLMDLGDVVIHVFLDALREYYDLESLWGDAPRLKIPQEFYGPRQDHLN